MMFFSCSSFCCALFCIYFLWLSLLFLLFFCNLITWSWLGFIQVTWLSDKDETINKWCLCPYVPSSNTREIWKPFYSIKLAKNFVSADQFLLLSSSSISWKCLEFTNGNSFLLGTILLVNFFPCRLLMQISWFISRLEGDSAASNRLKLRRTSANEVFSILKNKT